MRAFVLDTSVTMRWCFENASNPYAESILQQLASGGDAVAPMLWRYEVGAVLAIAERSGAISPGKAAEFLTALRSFDIAIDQDGTDRCRVTIAEAVRATGASRNTIKDHVRALTDRQHLTRHGAGRGVWYAPG